MVVIVALLGFVAVKALTQEDCSDFAGFDQAKKERITRQVLKRSSVYWTESDVPSWTDELASYCSAHSNDDFDDLEAGGLGW